MKTRLLLCLTSFILTFSFATGQVPQGFNYQAIARDATGNPISNATIDVKISVLTDTTGFYLSGSGTYLWEEQHSVKTNNLGLFNLEIGSSKATRTGGSALKFSDISWTDAPTFIGIKIKPPSSATFKIMGSAKLWSVPYALVSDKSLGVASGSKLSVTGTDDQSAEALFEVKRADGQTVFAVYPDAVNVFVPKSSTKAAKGGFAVGGFDETKQGEPEDYLVVTPDSVRIYIDPTPPTTKASKGGFAVGGYGEEKGINSMYFNLTGATTVNTVAASPQVLWYPNKNAFLAGNVHIGAVDSVGNYSTALGYQSIAMGNYSQAFGYRAKALGDYSTSIGKNSIAGSKTAPLANNAFAFGNSAKALGDDSYALGSGARADGYRSFAFGSVGLDESGNPYGDPTWATGSYSVAIGMGAKSQGKGSMALGVGALASGSSSGSFGYNSTSSGSYSTALGYRSTASNSYSGAFGYYSKADGIGALALGRQSWAVSNYSVAVGDSSKTTAEYASAFGRMAKAKGTSSVAIGYNAVTYGAEAGSFGRNALAKGARSIAIGYGAQTTATGTDAGAFGLNATANGPSSIAIGSGSLTGTTATFATAMGYSAQANGARSISIGAYYNYTYFRFVYNPILHRYMLMPYNVTKYNIANGDYSVALGNGNLSTDGGTTLGSNNSATGTGAIAIGHSNNADSTYSVAIGSGNTSRGYNAFAIGEGVYAEAANSIVIGTNNIVSDTYNRTDWVATDPLFVVGNGGSGTQSNALYVAKNGNTTITGNLYVTGSISSYAGTGDNLGNHILSQNLRTNGYYLSNDGGNEGIWINTNGDTYIYGTHYASGRSEALNTTDATGSAGTGSFEVANSLRLDGDEIITNTGTTLLINNDNTSNVQIDGGTVFVDATNNRLGINTTAPGYNLDVSGNMNVSSSGRFGGDVSLSSASPAFYMYDTDLNADDFRFEANSDALSILSQGKVSYLLFTVTSSGVVGMPYVYSQTVGATNRDLYIDNTGKLGYVSSSARYKKNIKDADDISWLYNLRPVTFEYKDSDSRNRQYGLIAEEVMKVNPDFVSFNNEGDAETVSYSALVTPLLKAVQDQKHTIESLKAENNDLKTRLEKLEALLEELTKN